MFAAVTMFALGGWLIYERGREPLAQVVGALLLISCLIAFHHDELAART